MMFFPIIFKFVDVLKRYVLGLSEPKEKPKNDEFVLESTAVNQIKC